MHRRRAHRRERTWWNIDARGECKGWIMDGRVSRARVVSGPHLWLFEYESRKKEEKAAREIDEGESTSTRQTKILTYHPPAVLAKRYQNSGHPVAAEEALQDEGVRQRSSRAAA